MDRERIRSFFAARHQCWRKCHGRLDPVWLAEIPRALAGRLRRAQTPLRALGIEIVFGREGRLGTRIIRITAMGENQTHDTVTTVSRVSDRVGGAGRPRGLEEGALIVLTMLASAK